MSESIYKYLTWAAIIFIIWVVFSITCSKKDEYETAADGLDLQAVGAVLKKAKDAEEFEKLLNDPNEGVNNLDLDENDLVDFIKVTEYGNESVKGFSLTTETATDQEQEIATIEIKKTSNQEADVQIHGNRQIYGDTHYYHSRFSVMDFLLISYMFRPHPYYASPWRYGYRPSYYRPYPHAPVTTYRNRTSSMTRSSGMTRTGSSSLTSTVKSPNAGKSASNIRSPLKQPTYSQKNFQTRNPSKKIKSGGFGRSPSRPSVRSYRSFGGK